MAKLYVGNLGFGVTSDELRELFEPYGQVTSAEVMNDRETGKSRGFGFVEMVDHDVCDVAIQALDGNDYLGRRLLVNEARPKTPGGGQSAEDRGGRNFGGGY